MDRRRQGLIGGGGLAVLVFAATRLMGGGGGDGWGDLPSDPIGQAGVVTPPVSPAPSPSAGGASSSPSPGMLAPTVLRDPFCPLVVAAAPGAPAAGDGDRGGSCPSQSLAGPMTAVKLVEVFKEEDQLHARLQIGSKQHVLHLNESTGGFKVVAFAGGCATLSSDGQTRSLCAGDEWGAAPS